MSNVLALTARWNRGNRWGVLPIAIAFFFCLGGREVSAGERHPTRGAFEVWQVQDRWQAGPVTAIVQSREGYLWLGTYHGLARYDGVRFTVFDSINTPDLPNGAITSLHEGPDGALWIGHETGHLTRFDGGQFQTINLGRTWPGGAIEGLATDEDGDLWLLNVAGVLFRVRDGKSVLAPGGASPTRKVALSRAGNGKLWITANGMVATLRQGTVVPFQFPGGAASYSYERVLPARDGGLWVVGNARLRKWRDGRWVPESEARLPRTPGAATCLLETRSGQVLAGTLRDGLNLCVPGEEPVQFTRDEGLSHDWVRALCEDHEGNIWVGTGAGFDGVRRRRVQMLAPPDKWRGCAVLSFSVLADESAWIGTEGAGLYHFDGGQWTPFTEAAGVSNLFVWSVLETRHHQLLVGTWGGGLLARKGDRFEPLQELSRVTSPARVLHEDRQGVLWIGTTIGLYRYEAGRLSLFAGAEQLSLPDVRSIVEANDHTLWFGMSGGGLGCVRDGNVKQFGTRDGLGGKSVECLYADPDGTLWIGTSDNGLTRFKDGKFAVITTTNGLPISVINQIVDDGAGNLWLGSLRGILRASKADLDRCADGLAPRVRFLSYGYAEGLSSELCSGGFQPGACRSSSGRLWFPTAKGLAVVDPANASTNTAKPPVAIEQLLVDGKPIEPRLLAACVQASGLSSNSRDRAESPGPAVTGRPTDSPVPPFMESKTSLRMPPGRHRFEFQYAGMSFITPDKMAFKYRLEGLERDWQEAGAQRVAPYSYLPPGSYTFRVIACNNDNVWNEAGASLALVVAPYFWQTWWFQTILLFGGAAGVGAGVLWATRRRLRRKLELLERQRALERERARIARDIHDDLGASLTRITMLSQSVRSEVEGQAQAAADVDQIYGTARELTRAMDEIVWAVNPKHDTLDSLVTYLGRYAQHFLSVAAIRCRLDVPVNLPAWALTAEVRHNVFLALKEALHNVIKHAGATEVRVSLDMRPDGFVLQIADNGRGFDWHALNTRATPIGDGARVAGGNGVSNMQKRLEEIGGRCQWETARGEGTRVNLVVVVTRM
ncbi:MAG TPA: two-component regulator propeller domain-containing protein [Candidatus Acidoferrum sp.]|nr:two-component regulator propeller domain-containing protein [Candidatus Acidoferrum sp.]